MSGDFQEGDWVRFYRGGVLVIGQIHYQHKNVIGTLYLSTDAGEVAAESVLETRRICRARRGAADAS